MKRLALVVLLSLLATAPLHHTQSDATHQGLDPAQSASMTAGGTGKAKTEPANGAKGDCTRCERAYHMPTRWHRFLPGMFR